MKNKSGTLYIGITSDLKKRIYEHKANLVPGFTHKYNIDALVYFETYSDVNAAIAREKQLKKWRRQKKIDLIKSQNPDLNDISNNWYD